MAQKFLFCTAGSRDQAEKMIYRLKNSGFCNTDISAVFPEKMTKKTTAKGPSAGALEWIPGIEPFTIAGADSLMARGPIIRALKRTMAESTAIADGLRSGWKRWGNRAREAVGRSG